LRAASETGNGSGLRACAVLLSLTALAGCELSQDAVIPASSPAAVRSSPLPQASPLVTPQSAESLSVARYYEGIQARLLGQGLMRIDYAPADAPFGRRQLVEDFLRVALWDEYDTGGRTIVAHQRASRLRRWDAPVKMSLEFGSSVPLARRATDQSEIAAYARRLARVSGHPVSFGDTRGANFNVLVLNEDERRAIGPRLQQLVPGIEPQAIRGITDLPNTTFCVVFAFSQGNSSTYTHAVAVIRGEHPEELSRLCIHEELSQGLGLANDSPQSRPSIFNDDEEFALLTRHDELLLKMLYDPRLRPGMTEAEARPIVETIAAELLGPDS
jgi:hypothetical protein